MDKIIIALVGAVIGFLSGLLAPWIKWEIEKRRELQKYRREMIKQWRTSIETFDFDSGSFGDTAVYSSLRPHMRGEIIHEFESPLIFIAAGSRGKSVNKHLLLDEVARIEKEWRLL